MSALALPPDATLIPYLAGVFDGEGTIGIYGAHRNRPGEKYFTCRVGVTMCDPEVPALNLAVLPKVEREAQSPDEYAFRQECAVILSKLKDIRKNTLVVPTKKEG